MYSNGEAAFAGNSSSRNLLRKLRLFWLAGQQNVDQSLQHYHQNQAYNGYLLHNISFYSTFSSFAMRCIS